MQNNYSALLIPPAYESGSLGDEAALLGAISHLRQQGTTSIGLLSFETEDNWGYSPLKEAVDEILILPNYQIDTQPFASAVQRYQQVLCLGADMMDGYYADSDTLRITQLLTLAAHAGARTSLVSFSFNDRPTPTTLAALNELPDSIHFTVRDPLSRDRLSRHINRPLILSADLAFLLEPDYNSSLVQAIRQWIQQAHQENRLVIGININNLHLTALPSRNPKALVTFYRDALMELAQTWSNLNLLLIPHDQRGDISDVSLAEDLFSSLPSTLQAQTRTVPFPCRAAEIKAICADLDGALTGRMHLAIACLGQGVPVADIVYQGKCEGLFHHFNLNPQELTLEPQQAFQPGAIAPLLDHLLTHRHSLRETIQAALPAVQRLAAANLSDSYQV